MNRITSLAFVAAAVAMLSACGRPADTGATKAGDGGTTQANPVSAAPTLEALKALEMKAFDAWKNNDSKFFEGFLIDEFLMYDETGTRLDKAGTVKMVAEHPCEVTGVVFSDEHMTPLGADAAVITMKVATEGTCEGQKLPSPTISASVYVRSGTEWKGAYHNEVTVVDPNNPPPQVKKEDSAAKPVEAPTADPATDALMAAEKAAWEAWKDHDATKLEALTAADISFVNIFGGYFPTKADVMKDWTSPACQITGVSVTDGVGTMLTPTVAILTARGTADGTCSGEKLVGSIRATSVYVKDGDTWKWAFGMNRPLMEK